MTQEGRQKKNLWWDACGFQLAVFIVVIGSAAYYFLA
jgi:hypothetical protein